VSQGTPPGDAWYSNFECVGLKEVQGENEPPTLATTLSDARKASVVLVVSELEKAAQVCYAAGLIPEFPGVRARATGEKGSKS